MLMKRVNYAHFFQKNRLIEKIAAGNAVDRKDV
jgi:hypothetical protein